MPVRPILIDPDKEVVAGNNQYPALFQALVQRLAGDGQPLEPQPQEDRALGPVNVEGQVAQALSEPLQGLPGALAIEGGHLFAAHGKYLIVVEQRPHQGRAEVAAGQADDGIGVGVGANDVLAGDDYAGAHPGQPQFRQAEGEDGVGVPVRPRRGKHDAGNRQSVSAVDDQWYIPVAGNLVQVGELLIGEHVAGGIGGAGHAEGADALARGQPGKVHVVLEQVVSQ